MFSREKRRRTIATRQALRPLIFAASLALTAACLATGCDEKTKDTTEPEAKSDALPAVALRPQHTEPPKQETFEPNLYPGRTHEVQAGDTLYSLAEKYYNNRKQWRKIFVANRNRLTDPNHLPVGMRLIIP